MEYSKERCVNSHLVDIIVVLDVTAVSPALPVVKVHRRVGHGGEASGFGVEESPAGGVSPRSCRSAAHVIDDSVHIDSDLRTEGRGQGWLAAGIAQTKKLNKLAPQQR